MEIGLLLIRVAVGLVVAAHGAQKLFGWFGGHGLAGTAGWLESMGFRPAKLQATVTGLAEFGGGSLLALGLITPLAAAAIAGVMLVAVAVVHWRNGFFNMAGGFEFNLVLTVGALALAFTGPGRLSLDHLFGWHLAGAEYGVGALVLALIATAVVLIGRKAGAGANDELQTA